MVREPVVRPGSSRICSASEPRAPNPEPTTRMNIGIICYASVGGSGIVATELAKALADRGHQVHLVSTDPPFRLGDYQAGLVFHQVNTPSYPLFREPQYVLSLANKVVQVARECRARDHPRALRDPARDGGAPRRGRCSRPAGTPVPRVVTTLHGTDITLVGSDPSFSEIVAYSIEQSDGVTAVSQSLRAATRRELGVRRDIEVIPELSRLRRFTGAGRSRAAAAVRAGRDDEARHPRLELPAGQADRCRDGGLRPHQPRGTVRGCCSSATAPSSGLPTGSAASWASHRSSRCSARRKTSIPLLSAVRRVPAAVGAGELRARGARGDGVRGAGRRVECRRPAGSHRARRHGLSSTTDRSRRHGRERDCAPDRRGPAPPRGEAARRRVRRSSASTASCRCTNATTSARSSSSYTGCCIGVRGWVTRRGRDHDKSLSLSRVCPGSRRDRTR